MKRYGHQKQMVSAEEVRQLDIVDYLFKLGYQPSKIRNFDYWYLSPLRDEKTPSFKVNRKLNRWYDHGIGKGGNLIDFAILIHNCTVGEFLQKISNNFSFQQPVVSCSNHTEGSFESKINFVREKVISSLPLQRYLQQRRIPLEIAKHYCKEVYYELNGKEYFSIDFRNDSQGYELRNPYFKASSSPKDITTIIKGAKEATIFEGFFDFLSFLSIHKNQDKISTDFVVLNSLSFFEKARPFMEQHEAINLYLDTLALRL